jgi:hypothetical protein
MQNITNKDISADINFYIYTPRPLIIHDVITVIIIVETHILIAVL